MIKKEIKKKNQFKIIKDILETTNNKIIVNTINNKEIEVTGIIKYSRDSYDYNKNTYSYGYYLFETPQGMEQVILKNISNISIIEPTGDDVL